MMESYGQTWMGKDLPSAETRRDNKITKRAAGSSRSMLLTPWSLTLLAVSSTFRMMSSQNNENDAEASSFPRIESRSTVGTTKWLRLETLQFQDQKGTSRKWDMCTRTTKASVDSVDAVVVVPLLRSKSSSKKVETLLVEQFRPPVGRTTIEFPAGLIDKNETPSSAAIRELREETGFVGEACKVLPQVSRGVCMSPGLTDETVQIVLVEVDLDNPYNHGTPKAEPDDGEFIEIKRVELKQGLKQVLEDGHAMPIEGLYLFAVGLELGLDMNQKLMGSSTAAATTCTEESK